jgi:preprotein translocase subunit SecG
MNILFVILIIICAVALMAVILVQNAKGGGLASNVGISTQMLGGVKKATDGVEKLTWGLMISLFVLCIVSGFFFKTNSANPDESAPKVTDISDVAVPPQAMPQGIPLQPAPAGE